MDISSVTRQGLGLQATGAAIRKQQQAFDEQAGKTVADSLAAADPDTPTDGAALTSDLVGMKTDQIVNSILFSVFRAQAEQQREAADLVRPREG